MYDDIYPEKKKGDFDGDFELEVEIGPDGSIKKVKKRKINLYPKGQTINKKPARRKVSRKARDTMKRAMKIRKYIKKGEKDKE